MTTRWSAVLLAVLLTALVVAPAATFAQDDEWVVQPDWLAEQLLVDVQSIDRSIEVDARYAGSDNFTGAPLPGYEADRALLRWEAAVALGRVQRSLRERGLGLKVWDGYRPVRATLGMVDWARESGNLLLFDQGYIALRSGHNLGLAVDLTLINLDTGEEFDLGTPFDEFSEAAHTLNAGGQVLRNRLLLRDAMQAAGFENFEQEWWHYRLPLAGAQPFDLPIVPARAVAGKK